MQTATIDAVQVSTEMMKGWAREWRWKGWLGDGGAGCLRIRCIGGWCWWESSLAEGHCLACVRRQGSGHHVCHFSARTQPHAAMQHTYPRILASLHPQPHDKSARIASGCHRQRTHPLFKPPFHWGRDESEGEDSDKRVQT